LRTSAINIQIKVGDYDLIFVTAGLGNDLSPRITEITLAIELAECSTALLCLRGSALQQNIRGNGMPGCSSSTDILRAGHGGEGLKTISAPFMPRMRAPSGKCRS